MAVPNRYGMRRFLVALAFTAALPPLATVAAAGAPPDAWTPIAYPVPLAAAGPALPGEHERLARCDVRDELVLPAGYISEIVALGGQRIGAPGHEVRIGTSGDFAGLVPRRGHPGEYFCLWNHEYIAARPWMQAVQEDFGLDLAPSGRLGRAALIGLRVDFQDPQVLACYDAELLSGARRICRLAMEDVGFSVLHLRATAEGGLALITNSALHRRVHATGRVNIDPTTPLRMDGPVAALGIPLSGTLQNCSGCVTPWGTVLTCEENFQSDLPDQVDARGAVAATLRRTFEASGQPSPTRLPFEILGLAQGLDPVPDARGYGWVCEVDPETGALWKHSLLGRFRHENVALRCVASRPLVAYLGDDRRGGHVWRYTSRALVRDPADPGNRSLFEDGRLEVAELRPDGTGRWIPLRPDTPLRRPEPEQRAGGFLWLPRRPAGGLVGVGREGCPQREIGVDEWIRQIERFTGKPFAQATLADLVEGPDAMSILLLDAYAMANACGATATARPEDMELHPGDGTLYIAFTDATGSDDGSPDRRAFPDSAGDSSRQYGGIFQIDDERGDREGGAFRWRRWIAAGEVCDRGGGFACADNMAFDSREALWFATDVTTPVLNLPVTREGDSAPGGKSYLGTFGNNGLFRVPTRGPRTGEPQAFAIAPMEAELTGFNFLPDGHLLLSVQHPGEENGARGRPGVWKRDEVIDREVRVAARDGSVVTQLRNVPLGSNYPDSRPGAVPRPALVLVRPAAVAP